MKNDTALKTAFQTLASPAVGELDQTERFRALCNAGIFADGREAEEYVKIEERRARGEKLHATTEEYFQAQQKLIEQWEDVQKRRGSAIQLQQELRNLERVRADVAQRLSQHRQQFAVVSSFLAGDNYQEVSKSSLLGVDARVGAIAGFGGMFTNAKVAKEYLAEILIPRIEAELKTLDQKIASCTSARATD